MAGPKGCLKSVKNFNQASKIEFLSLCDRLYKYHVK